MEALLARGVQLFIALVGAYFLALWFALAVWTFQDIQSRSRSAMAQIFSTLVVVLLPIAGVLIYLILRPSETLEESFQRSLEEEYLLQDLEEYPFCPKCRRPVRDDFAWCPSCRNELREPCSNCGRLVDLRWSACAYCGTGRTPQNNYSTTPYGTVQHPLDMEPDTLTQFAQQVRERLGARWPRLLPNTGSRARNAPGQSGRPFQVPFWRAGSDGNGNGQRWSGSSGGGPEATRDRADERAAETTRSKD
ncbi:double zinc ribbon domain-containing protein [Nitrolancea hollandica]|uniref:DZANK-type domain-containing protein n=1 Tax=Nitrolancea hollandica Lb TaxID=1129897 RepID=I4EF76_9BACT|nr:zinc ribbon domain-containing protein [Nitrolancea hollandica]CCF83338.1 conserved hypothetical protein [Nitrolancea hollandica Lb]